MNWRSSVIWLVLALAVGAIVYFGLLQPQQNASPTPTPVLPTPVPLMFPDLTADRITALRVQSPITPTAFALVRGTDGVWRITEGVVSSTVSLPAPADPTQVANLLQQLVSVKAAPISGTADLNLFGLVNPSLVVTFTASSGVAEGQEYTLRFGTEPVKGRGYYVQLGSGEVQIFSSSVVNSLLGALNTAPVQPTPTPTAPPTIDATAAAAGTPLPVGTATPAPTALGPQLPPTATVAPTP